VNIGIRRYIGVSLLTYNDSAVIVVETSIVILFVEDEMGWVEIAINI